MFITESQQNTSEKLDILKFMHVFGRALRKQIIMRSFKSINNRLCGLMGVSNIDRVSDHVGNKRITDDLNRINFFEFRSVFAAFTENCDDPVRRNFECKHLR